MLKPFVDPTEPGTTVANPDWSDVARLVFLSRRLDQIEESLLAERASIAIQISAAGHELIQVLLALSLNHPRDAAASYYRSRPFLLASGLTAVESFRASLALSGSPSDGRDVGVVQNLRSRGRATVLPGCGNVGAQYTPAVGWAQAIQYYSETQGLSEWSGAVSVAMGGDGSAATNGFWAALNIATAANLPVLFLIEDNRLAISVPSDVQTPGGNLAANLASFRNLRIIETQGWDPQEAANSIRDALEHVRSGAGPCLLRAVVPRLSGHSFDDPLTYRNPERVRRERSLDPIAHLTRFLLDRQWSRRDIDVLQEGARAETERALAQAQGAAQADPASVAAHLFQASDGRPDPVRSGVHLTPSTPAQPRLSFRESIRQCLLDEAQRDHSILNFGQDVGEYGGVHGVTRGLLECLGPERVFDTSLSEEGIVGRALGMALAGLRPVAEIQFRRYADAAFEQITNIGTIRWRTAGAFSAPVVVRIPVGYSPRGGDPWHAVCGEAIFAHTLGWRVAYPSNATDIAGLLRTALRGDDPTIILEHRALYTSDHAGREYPGKDYCLPFGSAITLTAGSDLTLVTWGAMVHGCLQAAASFPGRVEVIDLRTIVPWDRKRVCHSVQATGRLLVVHEDTITGGFAGEIIATVIESSFPYLKAPAERLATPDCPIPYSPTLREAVLPSVDAICGRIRTLLGET